MLKHIDFAAVLLAVVSAVPFSTKTSTPGGILRRLPNKGGPWAGSSEAGDQRSVSWGSRICLAGLKGRPLRNLRAPETRRRKGTRVEATAATMMRSFNPSSTCSCGSLSNSGPYASWKPLQNNCTGKGRVGCLQQKAPWDADEYSKEESRSDQRSKNPISHCVTRISSWDFSVTKRS